MCKNFRKNFKILYKFISVQFQYKCFLIFSFKLSIKLILSNKLNYKTSFFSYHFLRIFEIFTPVKVSSSSNVECQEFCKILEVNQKYLNFLKIYSLKWHLVNKHFNESLLRRTKYIIFDLFHHFPHKIFASEGLL